MRKEAIAAVVAVLVVASFGAGYLAGNSGTHTETLTSTSISISTSTTTVTTTAESTATPPLASGAAATAVDSNTSTGLDLVLAVNGTTLKVGQSLNVDVSLFNALPSTNSVPASKDWPFQGVPVALWPPCFFDTPTFAVVLMGNYTLQGLQSAANVTFSITCAEGWSIDHVVFQPATSQANLTGIYDVTGTNQTLGPFQTSLNFTTDGYWNLLNNSQQLNPPIIGQSPPRPPIATPFVPGVYTVAIADEWGQDAILHFTVEG
ncbi:MAG: hypothetical protein ACRD6W_18540 [Nitrososphaerales archaeon]